MFWLFCISEKITTKKFPPGLEARQQLWQSQPAKDQAWIWILSQQGSRKNLTVNQMRI